MIYLEVPLSVNNVILRYRAKAKVMAFHGKYPIYKQKL